MMIEQPSELRLKLERSLEAPRERVFAMLTEPVELAKWWGPCGFTMPQAEVSLRVGGRYRFTMKPPDADPFHLSGEFLEIVPPCRLVYSFGWEEPAPDDRETVVELALEDAPGATKLSVSQGPFATAERRALHESGWSESLERLRAALE